LVCFGKAVDDKIKETVEITGVDPKFYFSCLTQTFGKYSCILHFKDSYDVVMKNV
jgi:hypothetical protein